jgi:hypothetical protein
VCANLARQCIFCGSTSDLTREHVLPDWLIGIGLDTEPSIHHAGPLNRLPRQWSAKPFRTTVKMVCATCKTAPVSLLVSSDEARMSGYGVPPGEDAALYAQRDRMEPLPFSQDWIGSYTGGLRVVDLGHPVWRWTLMPQLSRPNSGNLRVSNVHRRSVFPQVALVVLAGEPRGVMHRCPSRAARLPTG